MKRKREKESRQRRLERRRTNLSMTRLRIRMAFSKLETMTPTPTLTMPYPAMFKELVKIKMRTPTTKQTPPARPNEKTEAKVVNHPRTKLLPRTTANKELKPTAMLLKTLVTVLWK